MNELKSVAVAAAGLRRRSEPFLMATVVRVRGSSYRRPGARMLVTRDRWIAGSVSGGCVEQDVMRKGWWYVRNGPNVVTYDAREGELGSGLGAGCDGVLDVLLEPGHHDGVDPIEFIARCYEHQERGALATLFGGDERVGAHVAVTARGASSDAIDPVTRHGLEQECRRVLAGGASRVVECASRGGRVEALVEAILPPPRLFVAGAGHDAVPVVRIARSVGWETIVCDGTARFVTRERFADADEILVADPADIARRVAGSSRAMAVVMAHDYERDRAMLAALLETPIAYIGLLGPRRRADRMLADLGISSVDPRIHAPVGLSLGAETPEEIALAIVAEAQAVLAQATATRLREVPGPIHHLATLEY